MHRISNLYGSAFLSGNASRFYYHFEASGLLPFSDHLVSVTVPNPSKSQHGCLKFAYYMHGTHVGALSVRLSAKKKPLRIVWTKFGNQGTLWKQKALSLQNILNSCDTNFFKVRIYCKLIKIYNSASLCFLYSSVQICLSLCAT